MKNSSRVIGKSVFGIGLIILVMAGTPAFANKPGMGNFQIYGGWFFAADLQKLDDIEGGLGDTLENLGIEPGDDLTFGARGGRRVDRNWGWEVSFGFFDADEAAERLENRSGIDMSMWFLDLSLMWYPGGGNFFFYGGPGGAGVDLEIERAGRQVFDDSSSEWSGNLGLGYVFEIGRTTFLRLDGKFRFYEADQYEGPDSEFTVALGWDF